MTGLPRTSKTSRTRKASLGRKTSPQQRRERSSSRPTERLSSAGSVVLLNKPYGVLCQFTGDGTRPTLADFIPQREVYPAGRLDADSEGLVVLTAGGWLQHRISDPRHQLPKTYWVQVEGEPSPEALERLRRGVTIRDYRTRPADVRAVQEPAWLWPRTPPVRFRRQIPTSWLELTIVEGRNRQVRHMTAAVGLPTLRLIRYGVGEWSIAGLAPGEWREAPPADPAVSTARPAKR